MNFGGDTQPGHEFTAPVSYSPMPYPLREGDFLTCGTGLVRCTSTQCMGSAHQRLVARSALAVRLVQRIL